ncbi:E3 ubiquitin-protein ligase TRIM39-like [Megalops cyprinoides]|uniref:E3 ubiquitin-protein ligase TRIM39-like n=1 Tax=Megalops cyprinoides TaxID=118141 RepID=UPI0018647635|nr:E3 ubiquitin-protein ligase TRIM39-like [Megalops cyprinoides]
MALQRSTLQQQLRELKRASASLISELQTGLKQREGETVQLQARYSRQMCFSDSTNNTVKGYLSEWSRKDGVIIRPVWKWIREEAVNVTLDPDTAASWLDLSADGKEVKYIEIPKRVPDHHKRFDHAVCVLAKEGYCFGKFYYEVQVGEKTDWTLGVAKESVNRKGKITLSPKNGYWTVGLWNGTEYRALTDPSVPLLLREKPRTVGVYVDYEGGQVSFYNVEARSHIYSFFGYFSSARIYPFFYPGFSKGGKNAAPLVISPVSHTD